MTIKRRCAASLILTTPTGIGKLCDTRLGRDSPNKVPFIAALSCNEEGHPTGLCLGQVRWVPLYGGGALRQACPNVMVLTDWLACFGGIAWSGFEHQAIVIGGGYRSMVIPEFQLLNSLLGNVNNSLHGSYHQISGKLLPCYQGGRDRFNRRFDLAAMLSRLGWSALQSLPMLHRLLKMAEAFIVTCIILYR